MDSGIPTSLFSLDRPFHQTLLLLIRLEGAQGLTEHAQSTLSLSCHLSHLRLTSHLSPHLSPIAQLTPSSSPTSYPPDQTKNLPLLSGFKNCLFVITFNALFDDSLPYCWWWPNQFPAWIINMNKVIFRSSLAFCHWNLINLQGLITVL